MAVPRFSRATRSRSLVKRFVEVTSPISRWSRTKGTVTCEAAVMASSSVLWARNS